MPRLLLILDDGTSYELQRLAPDPEIAKKAWRLRKVGGKREVYDVPLSEFGWNCDCAAATLRPERGECKHLAAMRAVGIVW